MRLLVTDAAAQPPRQATAWLIMTLGRKQSTIRMSENENQPFFYYGGFRTEARMGEISHYSHWFGDVLPYSITNAPSQGGLHQVLNLDLSDPALRLEGCGLARLPLIYGFQFQYGELEYVILENGNIEIIELDEEGFDSSWPYAGYPSVFPKQSFRLIEPIQSSFDEFQKDVWQWLDPQESEKFVAIVPPSALYPVRLWEEESDFDHIHVKFFFDVKNRHVRVYNECD